MGASVLCVWNRGICLCSGGVADPIGAGRYGKQLSKSSKMDKEALQQYAEAFEMEALAKQEVQKKSLETDKRLNNVVRKKRNVIEQLLIDVQKDLLN